MTPIQQYIKSERNRGVTIAALMKRWEVSRETIYSLEKTGNIRGVALLLRIASDTGMSPDCILGYVENITFDSWSTLFDDDGKYIVQTMENSK